MYRSSKLTYLYKYLFTPLFGLLVVFVNISTWFDNNSYLTVSSRCISIMLSWIFLWVLLVHFKLRMVETNNENLILKSIWSKKKIEYYSIIWIYQIAALSPNLIILKYKENKKFKKILILPSLISQHSGFDFGESIDSDMTDYIRSKMKFNKHDYMEGMETASWIPIVTFIFSTSLIATICYYYI